MKTALRNLLFLVIYLVVVGMIAGVADRIQFLKQVDTYFKGHPQPYLFLGIAMTVGGFLLAMGVLLYGTIRYGHESTDDESTHTLRRGNLVNLQRGSGFGRTYDNWHSVAEVKQALRDGTWAQDSSIRRFLLVWLGWALLFLGLVTVFIVLGSSSIRLILLTLVLAVVLRAGWLLYRS